MRARLKRYEGRRHTRTLRTRTLLILRTHTHTHERPLMRLPLR